MKIAAVVVLYNPTSDYIKGILVYQETVERLYVVDNSEKSDRRLINILINKKNVIYLDNHGNKGIAFALNRAAKYARYEKFEWMLTMDQDSVIEGSAIGQMKDYIQTNGVSMKLGIVAANYLKFDKKVIKNGIGISYPALIITSGSMINLNVWEREGGFENGLFIDQVDYDYSMKLYNKGYKLVKLQNIFFEHHEAQPTKKKGRLLWNYSPSRYYYIARNHLYMRKKYGKQFTNFNLATSDHYFELYDRVLHEKQFIKKVLALTLGIIDAKRNRYGKCRWEFL